MHIRCPHCRNPMEVLDESDLGFIPCESCGSSFSLIGDEHETEALDVRYLGHFQIVLKVGVGAFGTVWKARDTKLERDVAIKIPRKGQLNAQESDLFLREVRAAAKLNHPNIVGIHEVGFESGQLFLVSDYVEGVTLSEWLEIKPTSHQESAQLCVTVCEALQHAHDAKVVHQDLKPSNIMMDHDGQPHVLDFGLAKQKATEMTMTMDGRIVGTPSYMSPEQARGQSSVADRRADIYSLGVILFQLLTGELPFRANTRMPVLRKNLNPNLQNQIKLQPRLPRKRLKVKSILMRN